MENEKLMTWDLEALYSDTAVWEKDFAELQTLAEKFYSFKGHLADSPEQLKAAIEAGDELERLAEKLYTYAHLRSDEDTSIGKNRARVDRISARLAALSEYDSWFDPEIMAIPDARMAELLNAPELAFYRRSLEELLREKPHTLSEAEERLIGTLSDVLGSSDEVFSTLNDTDMEFGRVRNSEGRLVPLTHGSWHTFMEEKSREVRRKAFHQLYRQYRKHRNTLAATLDGTVKRHVAMAKIRKYPSALQASLAGENIPQDIYDNLIAAVRKNLPALSEYFSLRKQILKVDDLDMYDLYAPLAADCESKCSFDEAKGLLEKAFEPLGGEYLDLMQNAWSQRWVDAPCRKGKRSGAYSGGCYDSYPYILLSYNNTLSDAFTLAHEMGHSMHSAFSRANQHYHYAGYEIFVAEVASTCNELLLADHLLKQHKDDRLFRASLCARLADDIRATVYRQTMFAEFEKIIHEDSAEGMPLTADHLCERYYQLNADYHGGVKADKDIELEWARIPHFYYNFYVYKYATGMAAALKLSRGLLKGENGAQERYLAFLKAGGSKDVLDILRDAGVDLATPQPVDDALKFFKETVDELRMLLHE
ncbi:MAG: oligoendopeptidase F [Lentisphaerae bacterium]|nr:oligoendopeptidase F [Lentisphaerota bacterium]